MEPGPSRLNSLLIMVRMSSAASLRDTSSHKSQEKGGRGGERLLPSRDQKDKVTVA